jgi:hypothetical protein
MQCSSCHSESSNLREYSTSALDSKNRKTICTQILCPVCRIMLIIKPKLAVARQQVATAGVEVQRRVA